MGTVDFATGSEVKIVKVKSIIKVTSENSPIETVTVYDALGRLILDLKKVNANEFNIAVDNWSQGTFVVKATLQNGVQKTKKVVH